MDINIHNREYYLQNGTHHVPNLLSSTIPVQESIRLEIESRISIDPIKVLELGFGSLINRYIHIGSLTKRFWNVTLTDFSTSILPNKATFPENPHLGFRLHKLDLLSPVFPKEIYDVILSTYTLDSVDFPNLAELITFIKNCVSHLTPNGLFITIDKITSHVNSNPQPAHQALFRPQNLQQISHLLKAENYSTNFHTLNDFLTKHHQSLPLDLSDHGCLIVGHKS